MKLSIFIIPIICLTISCNSTKELTASKKIQNIKKELVGTWEFVVLKDEHGNKIDTIKHGFGFEIPKGPTITLNQDGTYSKQFTPVNMDKGTWHFNESNQTIEYSLYYDKPYDGVAKDLIKRGHATKDENGNYYEIVTSKVYKYSDRELILIERENRRRFFNKKIM